MLHHFFCVRISLKTILESLFLASKAIFESLFLVVDNTEIGHHNRIPLWTFGLLY